MHNFKSINDWSEELINIWFTDSIKALSDIFIIEDNNWDAIIRCLEWKNIVDIWAGFSSFIEFIRNVSGHKSKLYCIDPIYSQKLIDLYILNSIQKIRKNISDIQKW